MPPSDLWPCTPLRWTSPPYRFQAIGLSLALGIGFFIFGLLGWLLVMKKRVLKCDYCGAVVNAS